MESVQFYKTGMPLKESSAKQQKQEKTEEFLDILKKAPDKLEEKDEQESTKREEKEPSKVQPLYFILPQELNQLQTVQILAAPMTELPDAAGEMAQGVEAVLPEEGAEALAGGVLEAETAAGQEQTAGAEVVPGAGEAIQAEGEHRQNERKPEERIIPVENSAEPVEKQDGKTAEAEPSDGFRNGQSLQNGTVEKADARTETGIRKPEDLRKEAETVELPEGFQGLVDQAKAPRTDRAGVVSHQGMHVAEPEELPKELAKELLVRTEAGQNQFEIQINPEHLGKIVVRVMYEEGVSTVSILCSEKRTMELLAQSAREIGSVMEQNLGKPTEVYVEKQETENLWQEPQENDHAGRDSEQRRQKEEQEKMQTAGGRFLQELRLGLR